MSDPISRGPQLWTASQRTALIAILIVLILALLVRYLRNSTYISDPQPLAPLRAAELLDRIDPNTADVATLGALPTLGEKRAKLIVDYREHYRKLQPKGGAAYRKPEDLLRITGIGMATVETLKPFLAFPDEPSTNPTTQE